MGIRLSATRTCLICLAGDLAKDTQYYPDRDEDLPDVSLCPPKENAMIHETRASALPTRIGSASLLLYFSLAYLPTGTVTARTILDTTTSYRFHTRSSVASCQREILLWMQSRVYEKLALTEGLLDSMLSSGECPSTSGYTWVPDTDDISLVAGRAKWGLERVLGVTVPGVICKSTASSEQKMIHARAVRIVEAYRNGIAARNSDDLVTPGMLAELKKRYRERMASLSSPTSDSDEPMIMLLDEWCPIGRPYKDLVRIVGAEAESRAGRLCYSLGSEYTGSLFYLRVRDGIIRSMGRASAH